MAGSNKDYTKENDINSLIESAKNNYEDQGFIKKVKAPKDNKNNKFTLDSGLKLDTGNVKLDA